jgi:hypothetical protein
MSTTEQPVDSLEAKRRAMDQDGKLDPILGRIDLVAILLALLGACLLGVAVAVLAFVELVRIVSSLWSDTFERWLLIVLAAALVWIVVRWKKLCVF